MKDTYWKVRTASCIAVGSLGSGATDLALPYLLKVNSRLKTQSTNICSYIDAEGWLSE
jgi:hypothetical protein